MPVTGIVEGRFRAPEMPMTAKPIFRALHFSRCAVERGRSKRAGLRADQVSYVVTQEVLCINSPFGPKTPCEVRGSARFLSFLSTEKLVPRLRRVARGASSSDEDSESIPPARRPGYSSPSPKSRKCRHFSRHGLSFSRMARSRRRMKARVGMPMSGLFSKSTFGTPFG